MTAIVSFVHQNECSQGVTARTRIVKKQSNIIHLLITHGSHAPRLPLYQSVLT